MSVEIIRPNRQPIVLKALETADQPLTRKRIMGLCGMSSSGVKKHLALLHAKGHAYIANWTRDNGRTWAPMWAAGDHLDAPVPANARTPSLLPSAVVKGEPPKGGEGVLRWAHLQIPDGPCKTKFAGPNPWL